MAIDRQSIVDQIYGGAANIVPVPLRPAQPDR